MEAFLHHQEQKHKRKTKRERKLRDRPGGHLRGLERKLHRERAQAQEWDRIRGAYNV